MCESDAAGGGAKAALRSGSSVGVAAPAPALVRLHPWNCLFPYARRDPRFFLFTALRAVPPRAVLLIVLHNA